MAQLRLRLQTVTPMFMAGANPRGEPELRPPAFRGALRYWLRAALGGVIGDQNTQRLYELESEVFGSAADKAGSASAVNVRLAWENTPKPLKFEKQPPQSVTRNGKPMKQPTGRDYLYWSMSESRKGANDWKQFFPPESKFNLILGTRRAGFERPFNSAIVSLWLLTHLGGVGSRSRRTAGSLSVVDSSESNGLQFAMQANTISEATNFLSASLKQARIAMRNVISDSPALAAPSAFDVLHPQTCQVWVLGIWPTSDAAVTAIGKQMRDFRSCKEPDHKDVAKWLNGSSIATVERSVFGLPLPFRYSDGGPQGVVQGHLTPKPALERRASPLWLKVTKTTSGKFVGIATLFGSEFLPRGEKLNVKAGAPPIPPPKDYQIILDWVASWGNAQKVSYV